ncbi:EAL domain-containing protein [Photobacterium andalusiense]|uniref:Cyclic di-GMP phosphodiesterase Gmr n=1 Tax=Photobacterium andalusiense TaxID=2204296 RepID=A0A1Y6MA97_9GAMM|nr:EAL domain-containing protein [Photobacterium andalusiense]SMY33503.1 Cyclic di-GMP phosphodiesterase Gmr [Photobacterium andalusiense]
MRKSLVISLLFTLLLLILTVIEVLTNNQQNNDEIINKIKITQRQQQLLQQQHITQQIDHTISQLNQLNTYLRKQPWQPILTATQRRDFIQFSNNILGNNSNIHSITLIDYKNSHRLKIITTTEPKSIVLDNKAVMSTTELNNIDHAFSLPTNKTYISAPSFKINHIAYYQHITINNHQWVIKIEQKNTLIAFLNKNSLTQQIWIIDNKGNTLMNIDNNKTSLSHNGKNFKNYHFTLLKKIQSYNHNQIIKNNTLYTYSPLFIPLPLKSSIDFRFGNLSPWVLISEVKLTNKSSITEYIKQSFNKHFIIFMIIMLSTIIIILTLRYINKQKSEIRRINNVRSTTIHRYYSLIENTDSGIIVINKNRKITAINSAAITILELKKDALNKNIISHISAINTKTDIVRLLKSIDKLGFNDKKKIQLKVSTTPFKHLEIIATKINNNDDYIMLHIIDVTSWVKREQKLKGLSRAVEQSEEAVIITDKFGFIEYVNSSYEKTTGEKSNNIIGLNSKTIFKRYINDNEKIVDIQSKLNQGQTIQRIITQKNTDNTIHYLDNTISPIRDENDRISNYISTSKDITERINYEHRLHHLAHYDQLTTLPNRTMFITEVNKKILEAKKNKSQISIFVIEIDLFKKLHDSLGNDNIENILVIISKRIRSNLRDINLLSRLNNNQFGVIIQSALQKKSINYLATRLLNNIQAPISYDSKLISISASIGISFQTNKVITAEQIIKNANIALSSARDKTKNRYCYFSPEMETETTHKLELESELRKSINTDRYEFYYQPKVLAHSHTLTGVEALLRWRDKDGHYQAPVDIIPLLESSGLILEAGIFLIEKACYQLQQWQQQGLVISMAINISAKQLLESDLTTILTTAINKAGCNPAYLELEITESVLMTDIELAYQKLIELKKIGIKIAIDDFGTGYSSLAYLSRFPINILKIDREFVKELPYNRDSITIIEAIITLAHNLGLTVVAEGVENIEQIDFLESIGVEEFQGYYFNKPLTRYHFNRQYLLQQQQIPDNIV